MRFTALLIEDEIPARETLKSYLEKYFPNVSIRKEIDNVDDAIEYLKSETPHIIFLDVQLTDGKGTEIFQHVDPTNYNIVFTTAHEDYTFEAFELKSFGYLLKPLNPLDFKEIVGRIIKNLMSNDPEYRKIKIPMSSGFALIEISEIVRCESASNYTKIICSETDYLVSKTLKHVEERLINSSNFVRVHHSHLVNIYHIDLSAITSNTIKMITGDIVSVSRSKRPILLERLELFRPS